MKSDNDASPEADEEVIELTDIVKSGPEAEEAIIDLTDPIETVKAEPHETAGEADDDPAMVLDEIVSEDVQELVDLTDPLDDAPEDVPTADLSAAADGDDTLLDLEDALEERDAAEALMDLDLEEALDAPPLQETVLDLDEAIEDDETVLDLDQVVADAEQEIEADPEALDLTEVLDATETEEGLLDLDAPLEAAPETIFGEDDADTLEVIEAEPVELTEALADMDAVADESLFDQAPAATAPETVSAAPDEGLEDLAIDLDELAEVDEAPEDALAPLATADDGDLSEPVLDLDAPLADAAREASGTDDGDELDFKLDEMLAEAQADMVYEDDETDMELDLSEALADAAAENGAPAAEDTDTAEAAPMDADPEAEAFDLISEENIIELDDPVTAQAADAAAEPPGAPQEQQMPDNVIDLADVTGGYPTVRPTMDPGLFAAKAAGDGDEALAADDLGMDTDPAADEADEEPLNAEMQELEETLEDVFLDEEADDPGLGMMTPADPGDAAVADAAVDAAAGAAALGAAALGTTATGGQTPEAAASEGVPAEIPEEALDAALERVIKTMYSDRIEQMIMDVIKEAVTAEIEKVKRSLGNSGMDGT